MLFSSQSLWKAIRLICVIEAYNAFIAYLAWVAYGYSMPSWTIIALTVFYTTLILAVKVAADRLRSIVKQTAG